MIFPCVVIFQQHVVIFILLQDYLRTFNILNEFLSWRQFNVFICLVVVVIGIVVVVFVILIPIALILTLSYNKFSEL